MKKQAKITSTPKTLTVSTSDAERHRWDALCQAHNNGGAAR